MAILRVTCPECDAALTSKTGFTAGKEITCPKCDAEFEVPAPKVATAKKPAAVDDDEEDRPQRRKRSREDDDDDDDRPRRKKNKESGGYKNSPIRFVVLGVLVLVMIVLGGFLVLKLMKDRENAKVDPDTGDEVAEVDNRRAANSGLELHPLAKPGSPAGGEPTQPAVNVQKCIDPKLAAAELETARKLGAVLVGKWVVPMAKADDEYTIEYRADGTYSESRKKNGKSSSGNWLIIKATDPTLTIQRGTQSVTVNLKVQRTGAYHVDHTNTLSDAADTGDGRVPLIKK